MTTVPSYANPDGLGQPFSLYSHVAKAGDLVFAAGQVGMTEDNRVAGADTSQPDPTPRPTRTCA